MLPRDKFERAYCLLYEDNITYDDLPALLDMTADEVSAWLKKYRMECLNGIDPRDKRGYSNPYGHRRVSVAELKNSRWNKFLVHIGWWK